MSGQVWVFDVDGCLVDSLTGTSLRPHARSLLEKLAARDIRVVLWSAGGRDHAVRRAHGAAIDDLVSEYHEKTERDGDGRWRTDVLGADHHTYTYVDDRPEELPADRSVIAVSPYLGEHRHDRGLVPALRALGLDD